MSDHILMLIHRLADASPYSFFVHEQARALVQRGHKVSVISPVSIPPMMDKFRPDWAKIVRDTPEHLLLDGVEISFPRCLSFGDRGEKLIGGQLYLQAALPIARKLNRACPVDLVHAHTIPRDGHAGMQIAKALGVPFAVTGHGTDVIRYFGNDNMPWKRNIEIVRRADALMAVSSNLMARLLPYRSPEQISEVVHNGIDFSLLPEGEVRKPGRILTVGSLKKRKCMDTTIAAFAEIVDKFPKAELRIVGIGELQNALMQQISDLNLTGRARLMGGMPHAEVMREMAEADLFVLPSYGEGYGVVYLEAMAAGCVTIGALGEGITDTIQDGVNGRLVPAGDKDAVRDAMDWALSHPEDTRAMREHARASARLLTWAANAEKTEQVYARMRNQSKVQ